MTEFLKYLKGKSGWTIGIPRWVYLILVPILLGYRSNFNPIDIVIVFLLIFLVFFFSFKLSKKSNNSIDTKEVQKKSELKDLDTNNFLIKIFKSIFKKNILIIFFTVTILFYLFWRFEIRPSEIRSECAERVVNLIVGEQLENEGYNQWYKQCLNIHGLK